MIDLSKPFYSVNLPLVDKVKSEEGKVKKKKSTNPLRNLPIFGASDRI